MERGYDDELSAIAVSLPMIVRLNARALAAVNAAPGMLLDSPQEELETVWAWIDSTWIRGRHLIHFLLNWRGSDVVRANQYLDGWELAPGDLRDALIGFEKQASQRVAHLLRDPVADAGLSVGMPGMVLLGFKELRAAAPPGHVLHEALDEAFGVADRLRLSPGPDPSRGP